MTKEFLATFLSDNEQNAVIQFNQSDVMREAVKKILLAFIYQNGRMQPNDPTFALRNSAFGLVASGREFTNDELGADLRALWQGVNALELAFNEISKFIPELGKVEKKNEAR